MSRNTADTDRHHGGPGSSQQNADKPVDDPKNQPAGSQPEPGQSTNSNRSRVGTGGGERDRHHTHDPATKS
ncbi:hypothetical protein IGS68_02355 [Skermanella sp. TT6]|uniref:Uncharacterized protein n=1 Tax=Skermanella cutis TaxID=2775420 RepID=A0ABX7B6Y6_9PROT|nr:hypothetical protein [Skermanella sp. TT6]QQP90133.1 hypothetical protein IGS68_02355 [Skermanella sp. TT6]